MIKLDELIRSAGIELIRRSVQFQHLEGVTDFDIYINIFRNGISNEQVPTIEFNIETIDKERFNDYKPNTVFTEQS